MLSTREFDLDMVFKLLDHKWSTGDERYFFFSFLKSLFIAWTFILTLLYNL